MFTDIMMASPAIPDPSGYRLSLADGTRWHLRSEGELQPWLDQFARILRLRTGQSPGARVLRVSILNQNDGCLSATAGSLTGPENLPDEHSETWRWGVRPQREAWTCRNGREFRYAFRAVHLRDAQCAIMHMWNCLGPIHLCAILAGGLPFHAALAEIEGRGVLFAAAGGTGKSTCSRRLPPPWKSWCDDQTLVVRHPERGYRAHPFPTWSDYMNGGSTTTWPVEHQVPLSGIFFVERAADDSVMALGAGEAVIRISHSVDQSMRFFWDGMPINQKRRIAAQAFDNACALAKTVPAYRLRFSLSGRFWEHVEEALEVTKGQVSCPSV